MGFVFVEARWTRIQTSNEKNYGKQNYSIDLRIDNRRRVRICGRRSTPEKEINSLFDIQVARDVLSKFSASASVGYESEFIFRGKQLAGSVVCPEVDIAYDIGAGFGAYIGWWGCYSTDVAPFSAYFPLATRYSLDVPALFNEFGLGKIWADSYNDVKNVTWLSSGSWDPCNFITKEPIRSLADIKGKKLYTFPTAGRFLSRFGIVPITIPVEDIEMALRTGELDGVVWCGITEAYTVGWANATKYFLTNNISGAWIGSFVANSKSWAKVPPHLQELFKLCMDSSHYYRQYWYWAGEANLRVNGGKLKLTTIPESEWKSVEDGALKFWDEIVAKGTPRQKEVVKIFRDYNAMMEKAGSPYR